MSIRLASAVTWALLWKASAGVFATVRFSEGLYCDGKGKDLRYATCYVYDWEWS